MLANMNPCRQILPDGPTLLALQRKSQRGLRDECAKPFRQGSAFRLGSPLTEKSRGYEEMEAGELRAELQRSWLEADRLREQQEADRQRAHDKIATLELEVRESWRKRVEELEAEILTLRSVRSIDDCSQDVRNKSQTRTTVPKTLGDTASSFFRCSPCKGAPDDLLDDSNKVARQHSVEHTILPLSEAVKLRSHLGTMCASDSAPADRAELLFPTARKGGPGFAHIGRLPKNRLQGDAWCPGHCESASVPSSSPLDPSGGGLTFLQVPTRTRSLTALSCPEHPKGQRVRARSSSRVIRSATLNTEDPSTGIFGAVGGFYHQFFNGIKCTSPEMVAATERLVEIDLSNEFPPERRESQVDCA